jgi:hypothetical protein
MKQPFLDLSSRELCGSGSKHLNRRVAIEQAVLGCAGLTIASFSLQINAQEEKSPRALREMSIHKVKELGLQIWIENQPAWDASLTNNGQPTFNAVSPNNYHPPAAMLFQSFPLERVPTTQFENVAKQALRRASANWGLQAAELRAIPVTAQKYGVLEGFEGNFVGKSDETVMDVKIFVGQSEGRFPVILWIYTQQGKMDNLLEVIRRSWSKLTYL